jgi:hypothetical protein
MQGKLWIDKDSFQWVKVEAQVMHPVSIEGFLAKVEPGTHFELEKEPVATDMAAKAFCDAIARQNFVRDPSSRAGGR